MNHLIGFCQHNICIAQTYTRISSALACLSNKQLQQMLVEGKVMHKNMGSTSLQITDGEQLYCSDFGLAVSDKFTSSNIENHFAKDNADYDYASGSSHLLHTVLTSVV
ncbi:MAG: hypothetical protein VXY77_00625 [Pseudomonadota bacterium]|nr:hypothetical protein [Pseudomonadota bacterium]